MDIHWIQAYRQSLGGGEYTIHLDDPPDPGGVPWYDVGGAAGNTWFLDIPYDWCTPPCCYGTDVEFQVFLAVDNLVAGVHNVDIYEGIWWGYEYDCVPEPATLILLALGGLLAIGRRR